MAEYPKYNIPTPRIALIRSNFADPQLSRVGMRWSKNERATLCRELKKGITDTAELARIHGRTERAIKKYIEKIILEMIQLDELDDEAVEAYNFNPDTVAIIRLRIQLRQLKKSTHSAS